MSCGGRPSSLLEGELALSSLLLAPAGGLIELVASRFAAKEAAIKAHPHLELGFQDILILTASDAAKLTGDELMKGSSPSAPVALIRPSNASEDWQPQMAKVSISHDAGYSTAVCIGFEAGPEAASKKGWPLHRIFSLWS